MIRPNLLPRRAHIDHACVRANGCDAGRLFDEVRSRAGLAYSVSGGWDAPITHQGLFIAFAETARPADAITGIQAVLSDLAVRELPSEVIERKKAERLNSFVFRFASKSAQLQRMVVYDILGLPKDYLQVYQEGVQRVKAADVLAAAQRHLHTDAQTIIVVADAKAVRPQLQGLGMPIVDKQLPLSAAGDAEGVLGGSGKSA